MFFSSNQSIHACSWDYPIWQVRSNNADPLYRFVNKGKAGYINQEGKVVIKPNLTSFGNYHGEFVDGLLNVYPWEGPYVDKKGNVVIENIFYRTYGFSEGLAFVIKNDGEKGSYIDRTGKIVLTPEIEGSYSSFSEGLAQITVNKKIGFMNKKGKVVIKPTFLQAGRFSEGLARVIAEGPCNYLAEGPCLEFYLVGKEIEGRKEYPMCKFTFIDKEGNFITNQRFERAVDFSEGLAAVQIDGKWGFINKHGQIVISPQFENVASFSDGFASFKQDKLWGYINLRGDVVVPPKFEDAGNFADGLAPVGKFNQENREYENYIFIDKGGKQAFKGEFQLASHFFKGLAHVKLIEKNKPEDASYWEGKYAYINTDGKIVFKYENRDEDDD